MGQRLLRAFVLAAIAGLFIPGAATAQFGFSLDLGQGDDANEPVEFNLGTRTEGESYEIQLQAVNENCEQPQDFQFDLSAIPWLYPESTDTVRGLGAGQSGSITAILDLSQVSPGQYSGRAQVHCATCQFLIFNTCHIDRRVLQFSMDVEPLPIPPIEPGPVNPITINAGDGDDELANPNTNGQGTEQPSSDDDGIEMTEAVEPNGQGNDEGITIDDDADDIYQEGTDGIEMVEPNDDIYGTSQGQFDPNAPNYNFEPGLNPAVQQGVVTAATRAAWAGYEAATQRRSDCEDELARLRAAAQAAADAAAQADAEAADAEAAADRADRELASYQDELDQAEREMNNAVRRLEALAEYRSVVRGEDGTGSQRYQDAQDQVDEANDEAVEAQRHFSEVRQSLAGRQAAAEAARAEATAKRNAADNAQAEADAAANALSEKERECLGLEQQEQDARADAEGVQQAANQAAEEAEQQRQQQAAAAAAAEEAAAEERQRLAVQRCNDCRDAIQRHAQLITKAFRAMRDIGIINPNQVSDRELDIEQIYIEQGVQMVAEACAEGLGIATLEVFSLLDGIQLGYNVFEIARTQLVPHHALYRGDEHLAGWLMRNGHAENRREANRIVREISRYTRHHGNTQYLKDEFARMEADCARICCER